MTGLASTSEKAWKLLPEVGKTQPTTTCTGFRSALSPRRQAYLKSLAEDVKTGIHDTSQQKASKNRLQWSEYNY